MIKFAYKKGSDWFLSQCEPESIASVVLEHGYESVMFMTDIELDEEFPGHEGGDVSEY